VVGVLAAAIARSGRLRVVAAISRSAEREVARPVPLPRGGATTALR
jgi:hypothetical protein